MSSNRRRTTNPSRQGGSTHPTENSTHPTETTIRNKDKYKWSYIQEKTLIQLFDEAIAMNDYTLKNPTAIGREYMVDKFNRAFNMDITYSFFKNKLDEFKKSYKRWKFLTNKTGITVDPDTSFIRASEAWWKDQEHGCKLTKSFNRKPPEFWDVMQRCLKLHDVQSQSQQSARQRREQLIHEHAVDEEGHDDSDSDSGYVPQTQVPETQEEEEVYRVNIDDDEIFQHSTGRNQQRGRQNLQSTARRGSTTQRSAGSSRVSIGSGSRGSRRRQSFETTLQDSISGFREFQRQSLQQLRPGAFDQDDYDEFKKAEAIFIALDLPKHTRFYWACINALKELVFWRKYFIDIAASIDEDKIQLLENMTGVSRNNEDVPKQLGSGHSFGSPHSGGISSGSPSSVGNNLGGQNSPSFWGPIYSQWGTPPNVAQWGTPPNVAQWGPPPNAPQWGTPPNAPQWRTPPNAQWGTPPNVSQWETPPNAPQWPQTQNFQQGGSRGTTPTNVQYGFSVGDQGDGATIETSPIIQPTSSSGLGFTNYFETGQMPQTPRPGGLFNIWGTPQGSNESQQRDVGDEE